jgi:hypothetical protein
MIMYFSGQGQINAYLDTNNIKTNINHDGDLFSFNTDRSFEFPKGSGSHTIYASNIWIGSLNPNLNLYVSAEDYWYGQDFTSGPVGNVMWSPPYNNRYKRVWKISSAVIQNHITNYSNTNYVVPQSIADWPGNGNISNGEAPKLAPYSDVNNNNTYDPVNGDYPLIRGDQAIYFITNDLATPHDATGGQPLGIEIHGMAYQCYCASDPILSNTVFVNYVIINRSQRTYENLYIGSWTDGEIGDGYDDHTGSDSVLNMYYFYNGDNDDGLPPWGYGLNPPAQGVKFLNQPMSSYMYISGNNTVTSYPTAPYHYYLYAAGYWKDGSQLTYGDDGWGGQNISNYMFSGDPLSGTGWTENNLGNPPGQRRGIGGTGPFTLTPGGKHCMDLAFIASRDVQNNNLYNVSLLKQRAVYVQNFYNSQGYQCDFTAGENEIHNEVYGINVYPNPSTGLFQIESFGINDPCLVSIYAMNGQLIKSIKTSTGVNEKISLDAEEGIYFVVVNAGDRVISKKIVITK